MDVPKVRRYKTYCIRGLHDNIRSIYWIGRTFQLDALTEADVDFLISTSWPHIKRILPKSVK